MRSLLISGALIAAVVLTASTARAEDLAIPATGAECSQKVEGAISYDSSYAVITCLRNDGGSYLWSRTSPIDEPMRLLVTHEASASNVVGTDVLPGQWRGEPLTVTSVCTAHQDRQDGVVSPVGGPFYFDLDADTKFVSWGGFCLWTWVG